MDNTKDTPDQEVKEVKEEVVEADADTPQEGTVEAEINKDAPAVAPQEDFVPAEPVQETVPLAVYLDLKDDLKTLKKDIKESKSTEKTEVASQGVQELAQKYPDVDNEFIQDMLSSATTAATKKIEAKYTPILARQDQEKRQASFDKAFDNLFDTAVSDNPELPQNIDKDAIKELALTPKYRNVPVADILLRMYSTGEGKASSENEMRSGSDRVDDTVDFANITADQKNAIMADDKARVKYFSWLDTQIG